MVRLREYLTVDLLEGEPGLPGQPDALTDPEPEPAGAGVGASPEQLRSAAFRLKHDLGKYVRWSAPSVRETDVEALRARLTRDLCATRSGPSGTQGALEIWTVWRAEEGVLLATFRELGFLDLVLERLAERVPLLPGLAFEDLVALDELTIAVSRATIELHRTVVRATS